LIYENILQQNLALCISLAILFLIAGTATAGDVNPQLPATDTGLNQVPYNITGVFTTVSDITYDSSSGRFAANNPGIVYTVTQYDRLFKIAEDISSSPLYFAIDDKHGTHFFSYGNDGYTTFFRSSTVKSDDAFSTRMLTSSGGVATAQTALEVRNGMTVPGEKTAIPNLTGTWTTAQNSVYQINNQEGNVFSGNVTASGKTTSTRFAGYIDKVDEDDTAKIVMLCEKRNLMLGNLNVNTHNITIPFVLYADGRVASSPLTEDGAEWVGTNMSYNVSQKYSIILNSDQSTSNLLTAGSTV
jgi:predicted small secreted protein